jgi:GTPase SAR1 family protein
VTCLEQSEWKFKIITIGDASTGKSSLILRWVDNKFPEGYECTIGVDFKTKTFKLKDGK